MTRTKEAAATATKHKAAKAIHQPCGGHPWSRYRLTAQPSATAGSAGCDRALAVNSAERLCEAAAKLRGSTVAEANDRL